MARSKNTRKAVCPRCNHLRQKTIHHILPKRFFHGKGDTEDICRPCHNDFETILLKYEFVNGKRRKLPIWMYRELFNMFILVG